MVGLFGLFFDNLDRRATQIDAFIEDGPAIGSEDPCHIFSKSQRVEGGDPFDTRQSMEKQGDFRRPSFREHLPVYSEPVNKSHRGKDRGVRLPALGTVAGPVQEPVYGVLKSLGVQQAVAQFTIDSLIHSAVCQQHVRIVSKSDVVTQLVGEGEGQDVTCTGVLMQLGCIEHDHSAATHSSDTWRKKNIEIHMESLNTIGAAQVVTTADEAF